MLYSRSPLVMDAPAAQNIEGGAAKHDVWQLSGLPRGLAGRDFDFSTFNLLPIPSSPDITSPMGLT